METLEEGDLKSFPAKSNISACRRCYFLRLEGDLRFEDVAGPASLDNLTRREYVIRRGDMDILLNLNLNQADKIESIQKASGATIAIISYPEGRLHHHSRLELWGTHDQVKSAEFLILKGITKYYGPCYGTILMPPPICHTKVYVPFAQLDHDLSLSSFDKVRDMEEQSGAWIKLDLFVVSKERRSLIHRLEIFGGPAQIHRVLIMVHKAALEPYISKLEDENRQHSEVYYPSGQEVSELMLLDARGFDKVKEMEAQTGARIEVDQVQVIQDYPLKEPEEHLQMIRLKIFGSRAQIYQVLTMLHKAALKPHIPEDQEYFANKFKEDENKQQHRDSEHVKELAKNTRHEVCAAADHNENDYIVKPLSDSDWLIIEPPMHQIPIPPPLQVSHPGRWRKRRWA